MIHLDLARFDVTLRDLQEGAERLAADRDRATRDVDSLLTAGWTGRAADSFAAAWQDWAAGARDVLESLQVMTEAMAAVRSDLERTDLDVSVTTRCLEERLG